MSEPNPTTQVRVLGRALWIGASVSSTLVFIWTFAPRLFTWASRFLELNAESITLGFLWFSSLFIFGPKLGRRFGLDKVVALSVILLGLLGATLGVIEAAISTP